VLLPVSGRSNAGLLSSFFQTAISFKYFVLFLKANPTRAEEFQFRIKELVLDAIFIGSPFFYSHDYTVVQFLWKQFPAKPQELRLVRYLQAITQTAQEHQALAQFSAEQDQVLQDIANASFMRHFPEFLTVPPVGADGPIEMPQRSLPQRVTADRSVRSLLGPLRRIFEPRSSIANFPLPIVINELISAFASYPETEIRHVNDSTVHVRFLRYVPQAAVLLDRNGIQETSIKVSFQPDGSSSKSGKVGSPIRIEGANVYVEFQGSVAGHQFLVFSPANGPLEAILPVYRPLIVEDVTEVFCRWSARDDQKILVRFPRQNYSTRAITPFLDPLDCASVELERPLRLIAFRAQVLIILNFICHNFPDLTNLDSFAVFRPHLSLLLSLDHFRALIHTNSRHAAGECTIDRQRGLDVRTGLSRNLNQSMIAQFAAMYNPRHFNSEERPFIIHFAEETGIDCGGLSREFASELVKDIGEPRIGLFVLTPNGRDSQGSFKDCLVPSPSPELHRPEQIYTAFGGLLAIQARCHMTQPFSFPPVFWHYLAGGNITPEHIFEIDETYRQRIKRISDAIDSGMDAAEFDALNLESEVTDLRGSVVRIGRSRFVKMAEAQRYIAQCHACRIGEIEKPLRWVKNGFWTNLGFRPPQYVTMDLIEFLICGTREINTRELRLKTQFRDVPVAQIARFWEAIERMTNEQKRNLMQFATGAMTLPPPGKTLVVDYSDGAIDGRLPTASTCFFQLHLTPQSSADRMFRALVTAAEYTGTFERA
jgi:hypothetical protein